MATNAVAQPVRKRREAGRKRAAHRGKGRAFLKRLLSERNQYPDRAGAIDKLIRRTYEKKVAILALDMCGFSRLTLKYGIIHYMAMIYQMERAARPAILDNGGRVIKQEADNLYCVFPTPAKALEAAQDVFRAFDAVNSVVPADRDIFGSIGIGFGETLVISDRDMFGAEMNLACKLGEDLAGKSEILLTRAAFEALPRGRYVCGPVKFSFSEMEVKAYRFERLVH